MPNMIENAKKLQAMKHALAVAELDVKAQVGRAVRALGAFDRIDTQVGFVQFSLLGSSPTHIFFRITPTLGDQGDLSFHYDVVLDQFIIDDCELSVSFTTFAGLLNDLETFVRKVFDTVE